MEHNHDDRAVWLETWAEDIHDSSKKTRRVARGVPEGTHLYNAVKGNVAVRFPEYTVRHVYYCYYPDALAQGVIHFASVGAEVEKAGTDWPDDEDIATVDYMASITELEVTIPLNLFNDDGILNAAAAGRIKEIMYCPDCMYKRMLDEGILTYQSTQTDAEYNASERDPIE